MIKIFFTSLTLIAPLLILVAVGVFLREKKLINQNTINEVSKIILKLLLPIQIFMNIYKGDLASNLSIKYTTVLISSYFLAVLINTIIVCYFVNDPKQRSAMLQGGTRSNISIFALPLSIMMAGESIGSLAAISVGILSPLNNGYAIAEFEYYKPGKASKLDVAKRILLSPIIVATILAFGIKLINLTLPETIINTFNYMSNCVTGMSLIMVGASFNFAFEKKKLPLILYTISFKTIIYPIIAIVLALLFKINSNQLIVLMCISAAPIATSSFPTAKGYDTDIDLVSSTLVYSYVACIFTLTTIISILRYAGLI